MSEDLAREARIVIALLAILTALSFVAIVWRYC